MVTIKAPSSITLSKNDIYTDGDIKFGVDDFKQFLGHTQAPTSSVREFSFSTSHPFSCGRWTVAHNGVLTNHEQLKAKLIDQTSFNEVDTSVIPAMLEEASATTSDDEVMIICEALSKLKGTFGLWLFCNQTGNIYLARSGSTLFGNFLTNDFSSLPREKYQPLQEGTLYLLTKEGITSVGFFSTNSPFFAL
jgi:glucosamine 6-phosphate synthetase-like amidotransferase/phosphosugar isomerase protein